MTHRMIVKETVLDVLLYLFENYFDDALESDADQQTLEAELEAAGFPREEIEHAFDWLAELDEQRSRPGLSARDTLRVYAPSESARLSAECRGFLLHLEQLGILSADSRETVIDRLLALDESEVDVDMAKWVVLMVLFSQPGEEDAFARMEDLVFESTGALLN